MGNLAVIKQTVEDLIAERDELAIDNRDLLTERNELAVENRQLRIKLEAANRRIEALECLCGTVIEVTTINPYVSPED